MKILYIGDVYGESGRTFLQEKIEYLKQTYKPNIICISGENLAHGRGITLKIYKEMMSLGVNVITMGNHTFGNSGIYDCMEEKNLVLPANLGNHNKGYTLMNFNGKKVCIINLLGRTFMEISLDNPFKVVDEILNTVKADYYIVDFHAEATSEKIALGYYLDGRVDLVVGTHTHVQTNDERVLPNKTVYISDLGMTGPLNGVLGVNKDTIIDRFINGYAQKFTTAEGKRQLCGVFVDLTFKNNPKIEKIRIYEN